MKVEQRKRTKMGESMSVKCLVFKPGVGLPVAYEFLAVPTPGEEIVLPGETENFVVADVRHFAHDEKKSRHPAFITIELMLLNCAGTPARIGFIHFPFRPIAACPSGEAREGPPTKRELTERHVNRSTVARPAVSRPVKNRRAPRRNRAERMRK
jgi:hypothetical protein